MAASSTRKEMGGTGAAGGPVRGPILRALFDLSFTRFLTLQLVKVMYVAAIIMAVVAVISSILIAFSNSFWSGIASIFIAPFLFLIYIILWRVWLELLIVLFRIADYLREIAENTSILGRREPSDDQRY